MGSCFTGRLSQRTGTHRMAPKGSTRIIQLLVFLNKMVHADETSTFDIPLNMHEVPTHSSTWGDMTLSQNGSTNDLRKVDSPTRMNDSILNSNYLQTEPELTISYLVVMSVTSSVGMVGNVLVIASVFSYPKLRSKANVFIINLAIADSSVAFVTQGFNYVGVIVGFRFFADHPWLCVLIAHLCTTSCACSLWNMAAIAVNRYLVLCHRSMYQQYMTWRNSILIAILLWIITGMIDLPNYLGWSKHAYDPKTMLCLYDRMFNYWYSVFFISSLIGPPLITVFFCYIKIFIHVRESRKLVEKFGSSNIQNTGTGSQELRLAKTLLVLFIAFLVFWLPYGFLVLVDRYDKAHKIWYVAFAQMAHTNSSINCIIYAASNQDFRNAYKAICKRVFCWAIPKKGPSVNGTGNSSSWMGETTDNTS